SALVSETPPVVSDAAGTVSGTPTGVSETAPEPRREVSRSVKIALGIGTVVGALLIGVIGFYLSFGNLSLAGHTMFGFSMEDAPLFAIGVDAAIVTCLVMDLFMAAIRTSWPILRLLAHTMTGASIYFNAAAHGAISENIDKAISHGLMPVLFVIGTEAGRRILVHQAALPADHDVIPGHRWILAPRSTWRIFHTMRMWRVGYAKAMERQRERAIFDAWNEYKAHLAKSKLAEGSEEALALLPKRLAPFGLTVDEALALPDAMARQELRRQQEADKRARQLELDKERAEHEAEKERIAHRKEKSLLKADLRAAEGVAAANSDAAIAAAQTQAQATATAAARAAELEETALESAAVAEARARRAEADRKEAVEREAQAAADARAAELERRAAEQRQAARVADAAAELEAAAKETAAAAEARLRAAEADQLAAETERDAAETRRAAAELDRLAADEKRRQEAALAETLRAREAAAEAELRAAEMRLAAAEIEERAVEMEDRARLSPRQRAVLKVKRMIEAAGGLPEAVALADIQRECGVSSPATASEYRQEAAQLLAEGAARPDQA
ncbi:DUF2637 domain-containing protein, partial [Streptomyces sp. 8K308]|uniref:DUF2637 domain-containing protein n=1 Tax=Streptomyces sp. 8K308 TaxID=2530388 RepID=UPI001050F9C5